MKACGGQLIPTLVSLLSTSNMITWNFFPETSLKQEVYIRPDRMQLHACRCVQISDIPGNVLFCKTILYLYSLWNITPRCKYYTVKPQNLNIYQLQLFLPSSPIKVQNSAHSPFHTHDYLTILLEDNKSGKYMSDEMQLHPC